MKNTNARAYMKLIMITRGSSDDKCSSYSNSSRGNTTPKAVDGVLQQLKDKLAEADLFEALENKLIHGYGIKSLMKKLNIPNSPNDVVNFVVHLDLSSSRFCKFPEDDT